MRKDQLLLAISRAASEGTVTEAEIKEAFRQKISEKDVPFYQRLGMTLVLYGLGAFIVLIGIILLISLHWEDLNMIVRILVTLGSSIAAYVIGVIVSDNKRYRPIGTAFFVLSCILLPLGLSVTVEELGMDSTGYGSQTLIAIAAAAIWFFSYYAHKLPFFLGFGIFASAWAYFAATELLFDGNYPIESFSEYRFLSIGISFMLLGYVLQSVPLSKVVRLLDIVGSAMFFISALVLSGYDPNQSYVWEAIYPGLVFVVIYLGIQWEKKSLVIVSSLGLMAYIIKLTSEYFSESLGWPLAIILAGFALIGVGIGTKKLNEKYLAKRK